VTAVVHVLPGHPVVPAILEFAEGLLEPAADGVDPGIGACGNLGYREEVRETLNRSLHVAGIRLGNGRVQDLGRTEDEEFAEEQLAGGSGQLAASRERSAKRSGQSVNATAAVSNQPSAIGNQQSAIGNQVKARDEDAIQVWHAGSQEELRIVDCGMRLPAVFGGQGLRNHCKQRPWTRERRVTGAKGRAGRLPSQPFLEILPIQLNIA
jgi:hypothetical protein